MIQNHNRILVSITALSLLALGAIFRPHADRLLVPAPVRAAAADVSHSPERIRCVWATPLPVIGYRAAALSPDGKYIGVISNHSPGKSRERLALWRWQDRANTPLWVRPDPDASMVTVGAGGEAVFTCARLDPTKPFVTLRKGADGSRLSENPITLDGAVWDMQISENGQTAAVTTGGRGLYLFPTVERPGYTRFPTLSGIGNSVALTTDNSYLVVGNWDESGVTCETVGKVSVWQYPTDIAQRRQSENRVFEAKFAQNGRYILGISYANAHKNDAALYLWRCDGGGKPIWTYELGVDASQPKALVAQDGKSVVVSYLRQITHGDRSITVPHLLLLNENGKPVWDVINLMGSPSLVAFAPDGHRITVTDGGQRLYNLDTHDRITASNTLKGAATIRETIATPDGHHVLVYASDGSLSLFQIG